jgi:hypothetical protein
MKTTILSRKLESLEGDYMASYVETVQFTFSCGRVLIRQKLVSISYLWDNSPHALEFYGIVWYFNNR